MARRSLLRAWKQAARSLWDAVASTIPGMSGGYQVLDSRRKILPRGINLRSMSANELSNMSLPQLRALCRKLERDNPTARAAVEGLVAQVVGTGIALEPDTGDPKTDEKLRKVWIEYLATCDISGKHSIYDLQSQAYREKFIAGEFLWRLVVLPERAAEGKIPLAVLPLECEWLDNGTPTTSEGGLTSVNGIELDRYGRPVAYTLTNPEAGYTDKVERVPAKDIVHDFERRRALQGRGEPDLVPVIERIWQEGDLVDAELRSAINCAAMALVITSKSHGDVDTDEEGTTDDPAQRIGVGAVARLFPDEDIKAFSHNRPSQLIAEFRRTIRGDISSACRVDQRWLDRDYSRANYSSLRAAMLDNERLLLPVREWFGHATIGALYLRALPYLAIKAGVAVPKQKKYRLIPDGQAYVDPQKDVVAALLAIAGGLSTHEKEAGKKGEDITELWSQLVKEQKLQKQLGLTFDMGSGKPAQPSEEQATAKKQQDDAERVAQQQKIQAVIELARVANKLSEADYRDAAG